MKSPRRINNVVLISLILGGVLLAGVISVAAAVLVLNLVDDEGECPRPSIAEAEHLARHLNSPDSPLGSFEVWDMCGYGRDTAVAVAETSMASDETVRWTINTWGCVFQGDRKRSGSIFRELHCHTKDMDFAALIASSGEGDLGGSVVMVEGVSE